MLNKMYFNKSLVVNTFQLKTKNKKLFKITNLFLNFQTSKSVSQYLKSIKRIDKTDQADNKQCVFTTDPTEYYIIIQ